MWSGWQRLVKCSSNLHPFLGCTDGMYFQLGGSLQLSSGQIDESGCVTSSWPRSLLHYPSCPLSSLGCGPRGPGQNSSACNMVESLGDKSQGPWNTTRSRPPHPNPHPTRWRWLTNNTCIKISLRDSEMSVTTPSISYSNTQTFSNLNLVPKLYLILRSTTHKLVNLEKSLKVCYNCDYQLL